MTGVGTIPVHLVGGGGYDFLTTGTEPDVVEGGAGDDTIMGLLGADTVSGGPGLDSLMFVPFDPGPITVSLDGRANDGVPGQGANVQTDVENVQVENSGSDAVAAGCEHVTVVDPGTVSEDHPPTVAWGRVHSVASANATTALIAIASDTFGQTATAIHMMTVSRFKPSRLSLQVTRGGVARGKLTVSSRATCSGSVRVAGRTARLSHACRYSVRLPMRHGRVVASFGGTRQIAPRRSSARKF